MVYVVERYLPGLSRTDLLPGLARLEPAIEELRVEGPEVRYLGSTIVLEDEACFCEFEGPSAALVAEANRRAGLPFDRIVPALLVSSHPRRGEMSVSTSILQSAPSRRSHRLAVVLVVVAALIAAAAWAIATYAVDSGGRSAAHRAQTRVSAPTGSARQDRQYVSGIVSLDPAELGAAFGAYPRAVDSYSPASPLPKQRRYPEAIAAMSRSQQAAAFGTGK
jgi:hypothetical protein